MSGGDATTAPEQPEQPAEPDWKRRRRLAEIFGDVVPEQGTDERGHRASGRSGKGDEWYRDQVPPHHG